MGTIFAILLSFLAIFLILLVLVQRGRGGGLAGALGGIGGSSAFGAKAGDVFTRITVVTATIWIVVCVAAVYWANNRGDALSAAGGSDALTEGSALEVPPTSSKEEAPAENANESAAPASPETK
ncbi:MAG: preprotein translocase subunit SecG [Planctomycetes bacterium]|nr:preprotein translocase subunit SecG [Planctomycetota bacterium]